MACFGPIDMQVFATLLQSGDCLIIKPDFLKSNCALPVFIVGTIMIFRQYLHRNPVATSTVLRSSGTSAAGPVGTIPPHLATASAKAGAPKQMMASDTPPLPASAAQTHAGQAAAAQ